jgi:hypothetical protein
MSRYTFWFCILGLLVAASGFLLKSPDDYPYVRRLVTPSYIKADSVHQEMKKANDVTFEHNTTGFQELLVLVRTALHHMLEQSNDSAVNEHFKNILSLKITKIQVLKYIPFAMMKDGTMTERFQLKVFSADNRNAVFDLYNFNTLIDQTYKDHPLFQKSSLLGWSGLALIFIAIVFEQVGYWRYW